jgi:phytoene dehydrogenase-like protein
MPRLSFRRPTSGRRWAAAPAGTLAPEDEAAVKRYKFRGSSGKVNIALDALPTFTCLPPGTTEVYRGMVSISPSVDYLERAYDDAVAGRFSREPYVDMGFPTAMDPSMAPPGKHVMACFVQYAPYELAEGTWDDQREAFGDASWRRSLDTRRTCRPRSCTGRC